MNDQDWLAERFEANRSHLRGVAYRMLGSVTEADDAVQEAWIRLSRTDTSDVDNLRAWLTTVVGRVCLNMLRLRGTRRESDLETAVPDPMVSPEAGMDPEQEVLLGDSVGLAMLVVLDALSPAERVAFVLHDVFAVPFDDIGLSTSTVNGPWSMPSSLPRGLVTSGGFSPSSTPRSSCVQTAVPPGRSSPSCGAARRRWRPVRWPSGNSPRRRRGSS